MSRRSFWKSAIGAVTITDADGRDLLELEAGGWKIEDVTISSGEPTVMDPMRASYSMQMKPAGDQRGSIIHFFNRTGAFADPDHPPTPPPDTIPVTIETRDAAGNLLKTESWDATPQELCDWIAGICTVPDGWRPEDHVWLVTVTPEEPALVEMSTKETP